MLVFPDPFGPMTTHRSRESTFHETSRKIGRPPR
jgi:hypothetical protein